MAGVATVIVIPLRIGSPVPGLKQFDYLDAFLAIASPICFAFAWNQASVVGLREPYTYALLIAGILLTVAFIFCQSHTLSQSCRIPSGLATASPQS